MTTLRSRPRFLAAMLIVALLGLHASSASVNAAGAVPAPATETGDVPVASPTNTYALAFLVGYIIADLVNHFGKDGFEAAPVEGTVDETFDF